MFMNSLVTKVCIYSGTSKSYIYFFYTQETNCGVEQTLRNCAYVVLFLFHLLAFTLHSIPHWTQGCLLSCGLGMYLEE